jgi:hypothetical protein
VNGEANLIVNGALQTYSFHARMDADGTVTGSLQADSRGQNARIFVDLNCLRFIGNDQALVSGFVTQSNNPAYSIGSAAIFRILDNGEGKQAPPDLVSDIIVVAPVFNCTQNWNLPLVASSGGNIQVKQQ